jgi:hypothetical protein
MKRFAMLIIIISILFKIEAQERRLALVIGNGNYINGRLLSCKFNNELKLFYWFQFLSVPGINSSSLEMMLNDPKIFLCL